MTAKTLCDLARKFENTGSITDSVGRRIRTIRAIETIAHAKEDVKQHSETSCSGRASQLCIKKTSLWRIMKEDLNLFPYKIQVVQLLRSFDIPSRLEYAKKMKNVIKKNPEFFNEIIKNDKAHFFSCSEQAKYAISGNNKLIISLSKATF